MQACWEETLAFCDTIGRVRRAKRDQRRVPAMRCQGMRIPLSGSLISLCYA